MIYQPAEPCCGVKPVFHVLDDAMAAFFSACPGGSPEAPLIDWAWKKYGNPGRVFVDVGAHVGTWALPFAQAGMQVTAFEPNPTIRALLQEARDENQLVGLSVWRDALSDHDGHAQLTAPGIDGGMASIVCAFTGPVDVTVPVTTLDRFCLEPDVIKIDVEGAELDVLKGAQDTIKAYRPTIFFECWEDERGQRKTELLAYFRHLGYDCERTFWPEMWIALPK